VQLTDAFDVADELVTGAEELCRTAPEPDQMSARRRGPRLGFRDTTRLPADDDEFDLPVAVPGGRECDPCDRFGQTGRELREDDWGVRGPEAGLGSVPSVVEPDGRKLFGAGDGGPSRSAVKGRAVDDRRSPPMPGSAPSRRTRPGGRDRTDPR
jgi:hypothetical protein